MKSNVVFGLVCMVLVLHLWQCCGKTSSIWCCMSKAKVTAPMSANDQWASAFFTSKMDFEEMDTFSGGLKSINEWYSVHDEVDLGLTWDVIKYLHWETKWLIDSMTSEDFLEF